MRGCVRSVASCMRHSLIIAFSHPAVQQATLDQLPNEAILSIWEHLDDPVPLSRASKRIQELSKDTLWRAKWLMQRYEIYLVIFEAIARPKIFTVALIERLLRLGASLSQSIIQLIQLLWNPTVRGVVYNIQAGIHWGSISFSAYVTLKQNALAMVSSAQLRFRSG